MCPVIVTGHGLPTTEVKTSARFSLSIPENYIDTTIIDRLSIFPLACVHTVTHQRVDVYYLNLLFPVLSRLRSVAVVPSPSVDGLIIGIDFIRRGSLTLDCNGLVFCF